MATESTGGGNPNFFKTFKGAYVHAPSPEAMFTSERVMLSCVNDVQFQGDCMIMNYAGRDAHDAASGMPAVDRGSRSRGRGHAP